MLNVISAEAGTFLASAAGPVMVAEAFDGGSVGEAALPCHDGDWSPLPRVHAPVSANTAASAEAAKTRATVVRRGLPAGRVR
ncbi:hypothetical protein [Micromonospora pattaloongensis]|uniref:hypothetical protein n=1 Tax=Micromonospora pattaloongensis TaxID=405436 RepID=UPI003CCBDDFF